MSQRWRILIVVTSSPPRPLRFASSEWTGQPPLHIATMVARLARFGAEVRVIDQDAEGLGNRVVRREARLWRADLVLLHAGGSHVVDNPVPDAGPLRSLLSGWSWSAPVLLCGPLGRRYARELVTLPHVAGALVGPVSEGLLAGFDPATCPGVAVADGLGVDIHPSDDVPEPPILPAWQSLSLDSYAGVAAGRLITLLAGHEAVDTVLGLVRHAVHRAGARFLLFEDRDLGGEPERALDVARRMRGAAPGIPWACRVRADHIDPKLVLALARGGCAEVLVGSPAALDTPAAAPMDDPTRPRIESAVEAIRVIGIGVAVEHLIGRPGHTRENLAAWQRWFKDRSMRVKPRVCVLHAGDRAPGEPTLELAYSRAGCWDNDLTPQDVERAVRQVGGVRQPAGVA